MTGDNEPMRIAATYSTDPPIPGRIGGASIDLAPAEAAAFDAAIDRLVERVYQSFVVDALVYRQPPPPRPTPTTFLYTVGLILEVGVLTVTRDLRRRNLSEQVAGLRRYGIDRIGGAPSGHAAVIVGLSYDRVSPARTKHIIALMQRQLPR